MMVDPAYQKLIAKTGQNDGGQFQLTESHSLTCSRNLSTSVSGAHRDSCPWLHWCWFFDDVDYNISDIRMIGLWWRRWWCVDKNLMILLVMMRTVLVDTADWEEDDDDIWRPNFTDRKQQEDRWGPPLLTTTYYPIVAHQYLHNRVSLLKHLFMPCSRKMLWVSFL